jgi:hypothetical protein
MVRDNVTIPTAMSSLDARLKSTRLFLKIFFNNAVRISKLLKNELTLSSITL